VLFGVVGVRLQAELAGTVCDPVGQVRQLQKSLMSSRSFAKSTTDMAILADAVAYHARHIAADLRAMEAGALVLRTSLRASRHGDFFLRGGTKETVFTVPTSDTFDLINAAEAALIALYEPGVPYNKVGLAVAEISAQTSAPATLFDTPDDKKQALLLAMDAINHKAGSELLTIGSRLQTKVWQAKADMRSPAYTTRWSDVATVSAK